MVRIDRTNTDARCPLEDFCDGSCDHEKTQPMDALQAQPKSDWGAIPRDAWGCLEHRISGDSESGQAAHAKQARQHAGPQPTAPSLGGQAPSDPDRSDGTWHKKDRVGNFVDCGRLGLDSDLAQGAAGQNAKRCGFEAREPKTGDRAGLIGWGHRRF